MSLAASFLIVLAVALATPRVALAAAVALPYSATATSDATLTVPAPGLLAGQVDPAGLETTLAAVPTHGEVALGADGSFRYAPDAGFVGADEFTYRAGDGVEWSEPATVAITVVPARRPTSVLITSRAATLDYRKSYRLTGQLLKGGVPLAGRAVILQASRDGTSFSNAGASVVTTSGGHFVFTVVPSSRTWYRAIFAGAPSEFLDGSRSAAVRVGSRPSVGTPAAPSMMCSGVGTKVTVSVLPKHAKGSRIRLYMYRRSAGAWRSYGYRVLSTADGIHYTGSVSLPKTGSWGLGGFSPDDGAHASAWSGHFRYVTAMTRGDLVVSIARRYVGRPYVSGGNGPGGFDCSGFAKFVYAAAGISLPRTSQSQYEAGPRVSTSSLQAGDLVFYYSPVSHVGIYIGHGMMIDSNHPGGSVGVRGLYPGLVGATRPWKR